MVWESSAIVHTRPREGLQEFVHRVAGEALVEAAGPGVVGLKLFHHGDQFGQIFWMRPMECDGHGEGSGEAGLRYGVEGYQIECACGVRTRFITISL